MCVHCKCKIWFSVHHTKRNYAISLINSYCFIFVTFLPTGQPLNQSISVQQLFSIGNTILSVVYDIWNPRVLAFILFFANTWNGHLYFWCNVSSMLLFWSPFSSNKFLNLLIGRFYRSSNYLLIASTPA